MKNIITYITESNNDWECVGNSGGANFSYKDNKEFLWINTDGYKYGFLTLDQIYKMTDDNEDNIFAHEVATLKKGECYDADGGINIYIKIK